MASWCRAVEVEVSSLLEPPEVVESSPLPGRPFILGAKGYVMRRYEGIAQLIQDNFSFRDCCKVVDDDLVNRMGYAYAIIGCCSTTSTQVFY